MFSFEVMTSTGEIVDLKIRMELRTIMNYVNVNAAV